jgi:hypothetical protein
MKPYSSGTSYPQPLLCNKGIFPKYSLRTIRRPNCYSSSKGELLEKFCTKRLEGSEEDDVSRTFPIYFSRVH